MQDVAKRKGRKDEDREEENSEKKRENELGCIGLGDGRRDQRSKERWADEIELKTEKRKEKVGERLGN